MLHRSNYLSEDFMVQTAMPENVAKYLDIIPFSAERCALDAGIANDISLAHTLFVGDYQGVLMLVFDSKYIFDLNRINSALHRDLRVLNQEELQILCPECHYRSIPPLPELFGVDCLIDKDLLINEKIACKAGGAEELLIFSGEDFIKLFPKAIKTHLTTELEVNVDYKQVCDEFVHHRMQKRILEIRDFPTVSPITQQLIELRNDPLAQIDDLAAIIEKDMSLSMQVLTWSKSSFYGYKGEINSIFEAISRVLGFDLVLNLSFCACINRSFPIPKDGEIGARSLWSRSLLCAMLNEKLAKFSRREDIVPSMAYLSGLCHEFGYLLFFHLFSDRYDILSDMLSANSHIFASEIENYMFEINHHELGHILAKAWNIPEAISNTMLFYNKPFAHDFDTYSSLTYLSKYILNKTEYGKFQKFYHVTECLEHMQIKQSELEQVILYLDDVWEDLQEFIKLI